MKDEEEYVDDETRSNKRKTRAHKKYLIGSEKKNNSCLGLKRKENENVSF